MLLNGNLRVFPPASQKPLLLQAPKGPVQRPVACKEARTALNLNLLGNLKAVKLLRALAAKLHSSGKNRPFDRDECAWLPSHEGYYKQILPIGKRSGPPIRSGWDGVPFDSRQSEPGRSTEEGSCRTHFTVRTRRRRRLHRRRSAPWPPGSRDPARCCLGRAARPLPQRHRRKHTSQCWSEGGGGGLPVSVGVGSAVSIGPV